MKRIAFSIIFVLCLGLLFSCSKDSVSNSDLKGDWAGVYGWDEASYEYDEIHTRFYFDGKGGLKVYSLNGYASLDNSTLYVDKTDHWELQTACTYEITDGYVFCSVPFTLAVYHKLERIDENTYRADSRILKRIKKFAEK